MSCELKQLRTACESRTAVLKSIDVPARYLQPFEDRGWPRHKKRCPHRSRVDLSTWTGEDYSTVLIGGNVGSGKTMLATELLWRAYQRGQAIAWLSAGALVQRVLDREIRLRPILSVKALVIDDLGLGYSSRATYNIMAFVVSERYAHKRLSIYTSNLTFNQLYNHSAAMADRLGDGLVVFLEGKSQR